MLRCDWRDLPTDVRAAVQVQTGIVTDAAPAPAGEHSDITATLDTPQGPVFVKGVRTDPEGPDIKSLRNEAKINPHIKQYAPRLLWEVETGGWLLLGFEYVNGRHADFGPRSSDLAHLEKILDAFQSMPVPPTVTRRVERRWKNFTEDVAPMAGTAMVHTDINPANMLITNDERVYVIDWGWTSLGAAWVELAILIQWLIGAGHNPAQAENWVSKYPSWHTVEPAAIDKFAQANADRWQTIIAVDDPPAWAIRLTQLTQQWADYRRGLP